MNFFSSLKHNLVNNRKIVFVYKLIVAAIAATVIQSISFDLLEVYLSDSQIRIATSIGTDQKQSPNVVLVEITPETVKKFSGYPKASHHTDLLKKIEGCFNCNIVYNLRKTNGQLSNVDGSYEEKAAFAKKSIQLQNVFFIFDDMDLAGNGALLNSKLSLPMNALPLSSAPKTIDSKINSKSPVTRRIILDYQNQKLFHFQLAEKYNEDIKDKKNIWGSFEKSGTTQVFIHFRPNNTFPRYDFTDVYEGKIDKSLFNNKIIIIGENTFNSIDDYADSPFVLEGKDVITTSELHANMLETLINNNAPKKQPKEVNFFITFLLSIITLYVALSVKPSRGILILLGTFIIFWITSGLLLTRFNIWLDMAHPLLTIFLCYYFFIPYRLIIENRRSWEYLQKNKLLQQVEELKTNFISMMSHDLKTPIARIQGMTEVILKDDVHLSSTQREAVDTIKGSSDDLLKFINSILQYGRIESQGVELHKQSKDINQLLKDVIKKHEFLAKVKKIKINTELEPMFPVPVDLDLMKQVLSNLVENAIKYSVEDSTVTVKSREESDKVLIEVIDNGMGIPAEDLPNIFMKFYRSHNVKTSTIKGTGLGLYLAQYFVNLHKGEITVKSDVTSENHGSTFTVTLPLNT
ncbi:CHASE2 domain-containing protein [bacterium]|nr:CHASE2 domain-containing protein [bacterium]